LGPLIGYSFFFFPFCKTTGRWPRIFQYFFHFFFVHSPPSTDSLHLCDHPSCETSFPFFSPRLIPHLPQYTDVFLKCVGFTLTPHAPFFDQFFFFRKGQTQGASFPFLSVAHIPLLLSTFSPPSVLFFFIPIFRWLSCSGPFPQIFLPFFL